MYAEPRTKADADAGGREQRGRRGTAAAGDPAKREVGIVGREVVERDEESLMLGDRPIAGRRECPVPKPGVVIAGMLGKGEREGKVRVETVEVGEREERGKVR